MRVSRFHFLLILFISCRTAFALPAWSCRGEECEETRVGSTPLVPALETEPLVKKTSIPKKKNKWVKASLVVPVKKNGDSASNEFSPHGNLPTPLLSRRLEDYKLEGSPTLVSAQVIAEKFSGIHVGDIAHALLEQKITASPSIETPIRVELLDGPAKGAFLVGEAKLESDLKRVLLFFDKLRDRDGTVYTLSAKGLSPSGEVGLVGEYHSQDGMFFLAELATAGIAGFADSTINRSMNAYGNYVEQPGLESAAKKGMVSALSKTSERLAERAKSVPGYTQTQGYQVIPVIIIDEPVKRRI